MLVTTKGAKSGRELCSPLAYTTDGDDLVIIASMGGAPNNPNWYHNLVAHANELVGHVASHEAGAAGHQGLGMAGRRHYAMNPLS